MILNKPFWAIIDPDGKGVVWGHESPYLNDTKRQTQKDLRRCVELAKLGHNGGWCSHSPEWWAACCVRKVMVLLALG